MTDADSSYWNELEHHTDLAQIWQSHPLVRAAINTRISGDADIWPTTFLRRVVESEIPFGQCLSIGCGVGNLERDLLGQGIVGEITGVDVSSSCVTEANRLASESGHSSRVHYVRADALEILARSRNLDAIFFHESLHHFADPDEAMRLCGEALKPGGLLYLDEYVGPSRDEWRLSMMVRPNLAYYQLPAAVRRVGRIRPPINHEDPTEAVASSQILPAVRRYFDVELQKGYGGNLLALLYPNLLRPVPGDHEGAARFDSAIARLLRSEDRLLARGRESLHTVLLARPRRRG